MSEVLRSTTFQIAFNGKDGITGITQMTKAVKDADATVDELNKTLGENATVTYSSVRSKKELTAEARAVVTQMERNIRTTEALSRQYQLNIDMIGKTATEQARMTALFALGSTATDEQKSKVSELAATLQRLQQEESDVAEASKKRENEQKLANKALEVAEQNYQNLSRELALNISLVGKSAEEQAKLNALNKLGSNATDEQKRKVSELAVSLARLNAETVNKNNIEKQNLANSRQASSNTANIINQYQFLASTIGKTTEELQILNAVQSIGSHATDNQRRQVIQAVESYQQLTNAQRGQQGSMRDARGVLQQLGWQMQDVIVQLQAGTNSFTVFSQQGSQLAAAFGPTGAIVGVVIAIAGVIGGTLFESLSKTTKATETLDKAIASIVKVFKVAEDGTVSFTDELENLYKADSKLAELRIRSALFDAHKSIKESGKGIVQAFDDIGVAWYNLTVNDLVSGGKGLDYISNLTEQISGLEKGSKGFTQASNRVRFLIGSMENLKSQGANITTIRNVGEALQSVSNVVKKDNDKFNEFVKSSLAMTVSFREGKTTVSELDKALINLGASIESNSEKSKKSAKDVLRSFDTEYLALRKQTESVEQEYERRKKSIDEYVTLKGKSDNKSRQAYLDLSAWRKTELNKLLNDELEIEEHKRKAADITFRELNKSLLRKTDSVQESYDKQKKIIDDHVTRVGSVDTESAASYSALEQWKTSELQKEYDKREGIRKAIEKAQWTQQRRDTPVAGENDLFTRNLMALGEQKKSLGEQELEERKRIDDLIEGEVGRHTAKLAEIGQQQLLSEMQTYSTYLGQLGTLFGQVSALAEQGSGAAEALFYINQAIAFANAIVSTEMAATKALELGPILGIPAATVVRGIGYASAGIIAGQTIAGAFDEGGNVPSGQLGIVAEYGDELVNGMLVQGPARVTSRKDTAELLNDAKGPSTNMSVNFTIENKIPGAQYSMQQIDSETVKIIAEQVFSQNIDQGVSNVISNPNTKASKSMRSNFNVNRKL